MKEIAPRATGGYRLDFTLDGLPRLQTNNYGHWSTRSKAAKEWHSRVFVAVNESESGFSETVLSRASLQFTRYSTTEPDFDNLVASFKPIMDGLTKAGVIADDKPSVIGSPVYRWEKAKRGEGRIRVVVEEVEV